ncbi:Hypothetical protein D9617_2g059990 [Elsinoe fawcettii]|nr:Hypothetical protein D9617_2g059990 [Elsinoe fawcettii]
MLTKPTSITWTLFFKARTSTILLHVAKDNTFTKIREELLSALKSRHPDGHFQELTLPSSADVIILGKPVDPQDLSQGWTNVEPSEEEEDLERAIEQLDGAKGKGKGKATQKGMGNDTPAGAGLRDASVLAFKFGRESEWEVSIPTFDDAEPEDETLPAD